MKKKIVQKKRKGEKLTLDEAGMLALYDRAADFTKKERLREIVGAARAPLSNALAGRRLEDAQRGQTKRESLWRAASHRSTTPPRQEAV